MPSSMVGEQNSALMDSAADLGVIGLGPSGRRGTNRRESDPHGRRDPQFFTWPVWSSARSRFEGAKSAVHVPEELVRLGGVILVGPALDGIRLDGFAVAETPANLSIRRRKTETSALFSLRAVLLDQVVLTSSFRIRSRINALYGRPSDRSGPSPRCFAKSLRYLPRPACGPEALRNQSRRFMETLEPDHTRFAKLFRAVKGPGSFQAFSELLFVLLQAGRCEEVFAVERKLKTEEIEDGFDEAAALRDRKIAKDGYVGPAGRVSRRISSMYS